MIRMILAGDPSRRITLTIAGLSAALADRYRIERAATHVAAPHTIATRFTSPRLFCDSVDTWQETGDFPLKSLRDVVPSSDVSRGND
jgi:hypothetical protein